MDIIEDTPDKFNLDTFLQCLTSLPGIYKMLNEQGDIIYIGKAKNLKKRISSYFRKNAGLAKQQVMVAKIARIEIAVTHTEAEALLLESQLIKQYKPRYNICLRDDKSYPYIFISTEQDFPQVSLYRGAKRKKGSYYGPYPSVQSVRETLKLLQKIFPVRQCEDSYYNHRSRPCLQYQIERCTAPCVNLISASDYAKDVHHTELFLSGKAELVVDTLISDMEQCALNLDFEQAAIIRDKISQLRVILEKSYVNGAQGDADVIACASQSNVACIQVFFIRHGRNLGNKTFFPKVDTTYTPESILSAFIPQYYLDKTIPNELIVSHIPDEYTLLTEGLENHAQHRVRIVAEVRKERLKWLRLASMNAENALLAKLSAQQSIYARYISLQEQLGCKELPKRLECFDISHTQGEFTVASCVVFDREGPVKSDYRRFNIEGITPGDDCAAIYQAVFRRFKRLVKAENNLPDIVFIDGGKGQVHNAEKALAALQVNNVMIVGVSKGVDRKAGMEKIILPGKEYAVDIRVGASALLLIQHIRDEAHRFAITSHRGRRAKEKKESVLETIEGIGPKRRQNLLKQLGGIQGISRAGVEGLCSINGISLPLAQRIYDRFHQ